MKPLLLASLLLALFGCSKTAQQPLVPAFFYWETVFECSDSEYRLMDSLGCKKLYVKILDIGKNPETGEIEPYSRTQIPDTLASSGLEIIPCIFITNEVFLNLSAEKTSWLAGRIAEQCARQNLGEKSPAVLFDCDWTPSTQAAFFLFLEKMREKMPPGTRLEATIRLHQYKFPKKTGVPPVDRGMLMFYNTGDVDQESERNTIFHPEDALKYVDGAPKKYALPLDLALPLFSWGLVFREGELWKIIPGPLPLDSLRSGGKFVENPSPSPFVAQLWEVQEGTFLGGHYLRPGDRLRLSTSAPKLIFNAAEIAQKLDLANDATLAFFHLGIAESEHFSAQLLDSVCKTVRK